MDAVPDWRSVAAQIIYHAYPDSDLLPIEPPEPDETIGAFKIQAEEADDTLFLFLCREADDEIDPQEYIDRLDRAIRDIEHVHDAFVDLLVNGVHHPSPTAVSPK
jgi:hypothetical protein